MAWLFGMLYVVFDNMRIEACIKKTCFEARIRFSETFLDFIVLIYVPICCTIMTISYLLIFRAWFKVVRC